MKPSPLRYLAAVLTVFLGALSAVRAEHVLINTMVHPLTKTSLRVSTPFEGSPRRGFLPIKVVIDNGFTKDQDWVFQFQCAQSGGGGSDVDFGSSYVIRTKAKTETEHELMVPLPPALTDTYQYTVRLTVSGPGGNFSGQVRSELINGWTTVAFSEDLDNKTLLDKFTSEVGGLYHSSSYGRSGTEPAGLLFDPAHLMSDWRAFTGFDVIMMTGNEWQTLEPSVRDTILSWNRLGGHLHLFTPTPNSTFATFGINDIEETRKPNTTAANIGRRSLGRVYIHSLNGAGSFDIPKVANLVHRESPNLTKSMAEDYLNTWNLQNLFGVRVFNPAAVFIILIAFAIAVGPINLFVLAKPGMRHRLFFTTPLISIVASFLLMLLILFQDGFGGSGRRAALVMLESKASERKAYVIQEQISRTGVLMNRSFKLEEAAFVNPVVMNRTRWTHFDNFDELNASFRYANNSLGGDWFKSRSEQSHYAQTVVPTRARIERRGTDANGNPKLFSSLDFNLESFYYIDPKGECWKAAGQVKQGQEITLESISPADLESFWRTAQGPLSKSLKSGTEDLSNRVDTFLAKTKATDYLVPTLRSIRWANDTVLVTGSPVDGATAEANP